MHEWIPSEDLFTRSQTEAGVCEARVALAQAGEENSMQRFGVSPSLVRLSLGLENADDLWDDLQSALSKSAV